MRENSVCGGTIERQQGCGSDDIWTSQCGEKADDSKKNVNVSQSGFLKDVLRPPWTKTSGFNAKLSRMSQGDYDALQPKVAHQQVVFNSTWIRTALSVKAKVKGGEGRSLRSLLQPHTATAWPHSTRWQVDRWYNVEPASSRLVNINTERTTHTERGRIQKNPKVSVLYWFVQEVWVALDRHNEHRLPSGCSCGCRYWER